MHTRQTVTVLIGTSSSFLLVTTVIPNLSLVYSGYDNPRVSEIEINYTGIPGNTRNICRYPSKGLLVLFKNIIEFVSSFLLDNEIDDNRKEKRVLPRNTYSKLQEERLSLRYVADPQRINALWEVIENGNSWVPIPYVDAQSMFAAIKARFGGNEATKKTQKALLKQQYENFSASNSESLDSIFNRLQKLVSRLAILGVVTPPEDLNVNFLRSLPSE
ncbi:hypothetical protein Tco_1561554 [Tanacetum coccineum]